MIMNGRIAHRRVPEGAKIFAPNGGEQLGTYYHDRVMSV